MTQRHQPTTPRVHGKWQFPGGGIEYGEHPADTVVREVKEEVGIGIELLARTPFVVSHTPNYYETPIHHIGLGFPAKHISGAIDLSGDEETNDARWFTIREIDFENCLLDTKELLELSKNYVIMSS